MKKASLLAATLLLSGSAIAQNDSELLSAPGTTDFFTQQDRLLREFIFDEESDGHGYSP